MEKLGLEEIAVAVNGSIVGESNNINIEKICLDSRKISAGSMFVAIKGESFDGQDFIEKALKNGAVCAVCEKSYLNRPVAADGINKPLIVVGDTKKALLDMARYYNGRFNIKTVAVTGSVGKTTTKEYIGKVLGEKYKVNMTVENFNNEIGVPLTIFNLSSKNGIQVLEFGMNRIGEIAKLSWTAEPDIAVITNIGYSHIEHLKSKENIKNEKISITAHMKENGIVIMNGDDPLLYAEKGKTGKTEYFYGMKNKDADYKIFDVTNDMVKFTTRFKIEHNGKVNEIILRNAGMHHVYNSAAAFVSGKCCGLSDAEIRNGLYKFKSVKMRQNISVCNGITIIDDSYNASLESMEAAFYVLKNLALKGRNGIPYRSVAVLSDILELGGYSNEIHRKVAEKIIEYDIDAVYLYGSASEITAEVLAAAGKCVCRHFADKTALIEELKKSAGKDDVILFKASRGMNMDAVVNQFANGSL